MATVTKGHSNTARGTAPNPPRVHNRARNRARVTFKCAGGHRGLGAFCHRCEQARMLKDRADKGIIVKWDRKPRPSQPIVQKATKEQIAAMLEESKRLLAPAKPKVK